MGSIAGDDIGNGGGGKEERIFVSVRIRPLNEKEIEKNDTSDWECINNNTVIFKNTLPERAMYPSAYTFDRVFGCDNTTKHVYEEGAKEVALSVVSGINASIFAYGQTSSGKTYTMTGITEYSMSEIYDYIQKHVEREFVLKFSAMEIYNEAVKDLLNLDSGPLRLLDDPEKGTIVEKLTEEILRDEDHLKELLSFCIAQRQTGETSLNEMSSRSHQILRLSIESTAREFSGKNSFSTLAASVNFVDLAGSERASQALTAGSRLKEGCHINRSLLTLGTVIRKLSNGRNAHVPYRDSKLTRILQSSLGGNARTAIICTMSPARSHIEQSRNTLQFASCAKEVVTSAQVNVIMSDKALVKHLRKELARLEKELKCMGSSAVSSHYDVLKEKDAQIKKMEKEMKELMKQRDLAQSRLEDLLKAVGDDQSSMQWEGLDQSSISQAPHLYEDTLSMSETSSVSYHYRHSSGTPLEQHAISTLAYSASTPNFMRHEENSPFTSPDFEEHFKEVHCIEMIEPSLNKIEDIDFLLNEDIDSLLPPTVDAKEYNNRETIIKEASGLKNELSPLPSERDLSCPKCSPLVRSRSCRASLMASEASSWFKEVEEYKETSPNKFLIEKSSTINNVDNLERHSRNGSENSEQSALSDVLKPVDNRERHSRNGSENSEQSALSDVLKHVDNRERHSRNGSENSEQSALSDVLKPQDANASHGGKIIRVSNSVDGLKELTQIQYPKELSGDQELKYTSNEDSGIKITIKEVCLDPVLKSSESLSQWKLEFCQKQQEIVELWHACNVSLIHRSYFFLLIKGDPADSIYMEVEHRRLSFLRNLTSQGSFDKTLAEETVSQELRNIRREREKLCRLLHRLPAAERESLYKKWGIALNSKQRRLQLARQVWTRTKDMEHARESAMIVAKMFGFLEPGLVPKEMFGLSFTPQLTHRRSLTWKRGW